MSSPISRRSSESRFNMMSFKLMTRGESTCLRLKASNWRVMPEARSAADLICAVLSANRLPGGTPSATICEYPRITVSRLLKS